MRRSDNPMSVAGTAQSHVPSDQIQRKMSAGPLGLKDPCRKATCSRMRRTNCDQP
jgi:hypothetical protein